MLRSKRKIIKRKIFGFIKGRKLNLVKRKSKRWVRFNKSYRLLNEYYNTTREVVIFNNEELKKSFSRLKKSIPIGLLKN
ncbi:MAG: hypothetical protein HRT66_08260 [Flavobacteriaceae bacterium]|nr:hypothetical protein [Flavobacteriaceae bacterium]